MSTICLDAGFLMALYDEGDEHHGAAKDRFAQYLDGAPNQVLVPWPILYETVSTRLVRHRGRLERFRADWVRFQAERRAILLNDGPVREEALAECLADPVIRRLLADRTLRIDYFVTFNPGDFADVCQQYRRTIL